MIFFVHIQLFILQCFLIKCPLTCVFFFPTLFLSIIAIPSRNSFTQQMRRNALKNRKLRQSTKWRREKRRRSGKQPLKSSTAKPRQGVPPLSQVALKELRVRVRRHSVDFLLGCKDPTSKQRAILQQLEEVKAQRRPREANLKPSASTHRRSGDASNSTGRPVKVMERRLVHLRKSSRAKRRGENTATHQAQLIPRPRSAAFRLPVETDKCCNSETSGKTDKNPECQSGDGCLQPRGPERTQNSAVETSERDTIKDSSPLADGCSGTAKSKNAADKPLKQYVRVSLTRLPAPVTVATEKSCSSRSSRRSSSSGLTLPSQRASRSRHGPAASPEPAGGASLDTPNLRRTCRQASGCADAPFQREGGEKEGSTEPRAAAGAEEQQDNVETQRGKAKAAPALVMVKSSERHRGPRNLGRAADQDGGARGPSGEVNQQRARRCAQHIVIKQAKVLLSDILRKDESLMESRLYRHLVGRFSASSSKEAQSAEEEDQADINGGRNHRSVQGRLMRHRRTRPRAAKAKCQGKQSVRGHLGPESGAAAAQSDPCEDAAAQPSQSQQGHHSPPAALRNTLPQEPLISASATSSLQADSSLQAHTQSNIPLKKRTFRSSVAIDSEPGVTGASGQSCKDGAKAKSAGTPRPGAVPEAGKQENKDGKGRRRRTEWQRLTRKKVPAVTRELRPRNYQVKRCSSTVQEGQEAGESRAQDAASHPPTEEKAGQDGAGALNPHRSQQGGALIQPAGSEKSEPDPGLKILFKRRKGKVWQMQGASFKGAKGAFKTEKPESLVACDPFKAIMDSVSILNMEMEAARAHVHASRKSNNRLRRLKRRGERLRKAKTLPSGETQGPCETRRDGVDAKDGLDRRRARPLAETPANGGEGSSGLLGRGAKSEDGFVKSCMFQSGSRQKADLGDLLLPVLKLRRRTEDIWEVDGKDERRQAPLKAEADLKKEPKGRVFGTQKTGRLDLARLKEECPPPQRPTSNPCFKTEPPPFTLSLSPLSLSSPLSDSRGHVLSPSADAAAERPEVNSGGRKQRPGVERAHRYGPVDTPASCLSHTLQQIDNSLSRLSEGLCSSQVLEKPPPCPLVSAPVIQPPSQSPPFAAADNMLSGEPAFPNCCDDLLDFQCLNFEGYYQPPNMLPSSPSDLCSLDPPSDPFSSPLSHSPSDTWTTETPYLGPPSPAGSFAGEDLHFFPSLISSKNDCVPLEYEAKDAPKDRASPNSSFTFPALCDSETAAKDRIPSKNPGGRHPRDELKSPPSSAAGKPRLPAAAPAATSQTAVSLAPPAAFGVRAAGVQSKVQSSLRNQGPFHRVAPPSRSPLFGTAQSNFVRGSSQSCFPRSVPSSQTSNRFLTPSLFSLRNPNPSETPRFQTSTVIHRVLKFQEGNPSQNLDGAPCKEAMIACRTGAGKPGATEKMQPNHKAAFVPDAHHRANVSAQGFSKDGGHLSPPSRPGAYFSKAGSSFLPPFSKSRMSSEKHEAVDATLAYRSPPGLPRSCFPNKVSDLYSAPQQNKSAPSDKHQACYAHQDPFDFSFGSSLSHMPQESGPQLNHSGPPGPPAGKSQPLLSSAAFPYGYQGAPYVLNFSGDHSLTLGLRDGAEGRPGLGSANYTYHCLMEPSGTQGRLVLEPCGPPLSAPTSFSLGGFSGLKGQEEHCRKDTQPQFLHREHLGPTHYGPATAPHSMGPSKPKRVRLVVTDGTVDLDLQYSD